MLKDDEFMKSYFANIQETYFGLCLEEFKERLKYDILPCDLHSNYVSLNTKQNWQL
jgi:hypothetical protein